MLHKTIILLAGFWTLAGAQASQKSECNQDILDKTFVTQCNPSLCEPVLEGLGANFTQDEWPSTSAEVVQIVSSRAGKRFAVIRHKAFDTNKYFYEESHVNGSMFIDTEVKYQKILGFGTTLTDAACKNVDDLPEEIRSKLVNDYFSPSSGIGLNLIRVAIGSTKYSYSNYALDHPDDSQIELSPYDVDHRIPLIKDALKVAGKLKNRIKVIASSASAPSEYKVNNQLIRGGYLKDDKIDNYATYLVNYIGAYKSHSVDIWSLLISEAPVSTERDTGSNDTMDYSSMSMKPSQAIKLVKSINQVKSARPDLAKFRLLILGDDRTYIPVWADSLFGSQEVKGSVAGLGYACDKSSTSPYDNLVYVTNRHPSKYVLTVKGSYNSPMKLGNWQYAENYITEVMRNLVFGSVGWIDFNMALDLQGGPVINDRFKADAAVIVDAKRSAYYRNPMFYAIGHLSRYVKPGSIRVKMDFFSAPHMYANQYAAFITPDNYLAVVVANNNVHPMPVNIGINTRTKVEAMLDTKSFNTFIFRL